MRPPDGQAGRPLHQGGAALRRHRGQVHRRRHHGHLRRAQVAGPIEKCSGAVGFEAVATEHHWVVHISGGSVGRGDLTPDREAVGHLTCLGTTPAPRPRHIPPHAKESSALLVVGSRGLLKWVRDPNAATFIVVDTAAKPIPGRFRLEAPSDREIRAARAS